MDLFTDKANSIIKELKHLQEKVIYDSTKDNAEEDDQQQSKQSTPDEIAMGLTPQALGAINVAKKLSTQAKGGVFFNRNPQQKMDKAYGDMLGKISQRISNISKNL